MPNAAGAFEYAPMIRTSQDENFEEVSKVLDETSEKVISLALQPGDLQLFKGRYSLHRVTPLEGPTPPLCCHLFLCRRAEYGGQRESEPDSFTEERCPFTTNDPDSGQTRW